MIRYEFLLDYKNNGKLINLQDLKNFDIPNNSVYPFICFSVIKSYNKKLDVIEFLSNFKGELNKFTYLKINFYHDKEIKPFKTRHFYVANDNVQELSKTKYVYRHSVSVIEFIELTHLKSTSFNN